MICCYRCSRKARRMLELSPELPQLRCIRAGDQLSLTSLVSSICGGVAWRIILVCICAEGWKSILGRTHAAAGCCLGGWWSLEESKQPASGGRTTGRRRRRPSMGDYDYLIKFLALGDSGVGKTSFLVISVVILVAKWFVRWLVVRCSIDTPTTRSPASSFLP